MIYLQITLIWFVLGMQTSPKTAILTQLAQVGKETCLKTIISAVPFCATGGA